MDDLSLSRKLWHFWVEGHIGYGGRWYYSVAEKLGLLGVCLAQRARPRTNLLAGPFVGEFGYEVMQWQAFVRDRKRFYKEVHVYTYPGRDYLYEGCRMHYHDVVLKSAGQAYGRPNRAEALKLAEAKAAEIGLTDYDVFDPSLLCTRYHKTLFWGQDFKLFQEQPKSSKVLDVAFHFRAVQKTGPDQENKNYDPKLCDELVRQCSNRGISTCCIGHPDYSYCPPESADYRSVDLSQTVAGICSARLVSGENSGPMHLANLCGKPTVLWAQHQWRIDYSLRWNPFRVPIYIAANNTSQPPPPLVTEALANALADLKAKSKDFTQPLYTLPAQPIAPY